MELDSVFGSLQHRWEYVQDRFGTGVVFLQKQRNNLVLFERVAQVIVACLHLAGKATHFAAFHTTLSAGSMHSFYKFFQRPYLYLYPYSEDRVDIDFLYQSLQKLEDPIHNLRADLTGFFERMKKEDVAFASREKFADALANRLSVEQVNVDDVRLKKLSLPEHISSVFDLFIQGETVLVCLNEWKLLSSAALAERVATLSWFQGIREWSLLQHLKKLSLLAAGFKFYESCRSLHEGRKEVWEKTQLIWDRAAAFFDILYFGAQYLQLTSYPQFSASWIHGLSLLSDLVGIARILGKRQAPYLSEQVATV